MSKPLVVVESPTKVKTLKKYLGNHYNIAATVGHIKDLPVRELGIDVEADFQPTYQTVPGKQKVITALKKAAGDTEEVYLAPDPDREGEAIAWHTAQLLKKPGRRFHRVLFHELTKTGIGRAMASPQTLDDHKYDAQKTRRILDRLVGYQISPILWRKVKGGLSAGRVQSVAVRIICERERAIQAFQPQEYWSITAHLKADQPPVFEARLARRGGKKIAIANQAAAQTILDELNRAEFRVAKVVNRTTRRNPLPPFTTSKLQQEAISKLRFSARKTMQVAQQLYEGIALGQGEQVGLITYMRTDSTRISQEAALEAAQLIRTRFGEDYGLKKPRFFKNRSSAQDAHEAIRPTSVARSPEAVKSFLNRDQQALYALIWKRFVASQMQQALIDTISVEIEAGSYGFNASGATVRFDGFMKLYRSSEEEARQKKEQESRKLPPLTKEQRLEPQQVVPKQHFTIPPPRFSEASLVKELEENGIGRPSTYAAILSTIRDKGYVRLERRYFRPSELGFIVNDLIVESFPEEFDVEFTAKMERELDQIEAGKIESLEVLNAFYNSFKSRLEAATSGMRSMKAHGIPTQLTCPECQQHKLHIKMGKNGHFLACNGYPDCRYTNNYSRDDNGTIVPDDKQTEEIEDQACPKCNGPLVAKQGRYGRFIACKRYPQCDFTQSLNANGQAQQIGVACPRNNCDGQIVQRTSRRGKLFYGCNRYPQCDFASWDKPVAVACPLCQAPYLVEKETKRDGRIWTCADRTCGYKHTAGDDPQSGTE